ncbi:MAG: AI-2E family transporter [Bacteroidales bacterium]|nr:AI-2E family transporter [Bacteroidales bacterium]
MKSLSGIYKYLLGSAGLIIMILFIMFFPNIVGWILISVVVAMIGGPLVNLMTKIRYRKFHFPRWLAALITILTFMFVIFLFFRFLIPLIASQVNEFQKLDTHAISTGLDEPIKQIDAFIIDNNLVSEEDFSIEELVSNKLQSLINIGDIGTLVSNIFSKLGNLLMAVFSIIFISFFFLKEQTLFDTGVLAMVPANSEEKTKNALISIKRLTSRYFIGLILEIFFMMTLISSGLMIIGLNFSLAILIGLLAGLFNVIPYLGPWIGATIGIILALAANLNLDFYAELLPMSFYIVLVFLTAQLTDNILFQPLIYSKSVKAHPLEIFLVIIIAGSIAGIIGMMLAIPAYTVLRVIAKEFFSQAKIVQKITENINVDQEKRRKKQKNEDI